MHRRPGDRRSTTTTDIVVVGSGGAGLFAALTAADRGASVTLISQSSLSETSSWRAQGGLAAAIGEGDSPRDHFLDTTSAGRGLCRESAVKVVCDEAPSVVEELARRGVAFDARADGSVDLGLEGGHGRRRIVHAGGSETGRRIAGVLSDLVVASPAVSVVEGTSVTGVLMGDGRCCGVSTDLTAFAAGATVLATGGAAALWARTTNPAGTTGGGVATALAAGAEVADMEMIQFHPTALVVRETAESPDAERFDGFLISEAVRGEGARLLAADGARFVNELAPRDTVARKVVEQMAADGRPWVDLDMTEIDPARFPNVVRALEQAGFDPRREPIPVSPAAHYTIGGIVTDLDGRSTLPGLFAIGECASTGLHGANRLASNSLTECFVFGRRSGLAAARDTSDHKPEAEASFEVVTPAGRLDAPNAVREMLWKNAGLIRNPHDLADLAGGRHPLVALVASSALKRNETRGVHCRVDLPDTDPALDGLHVVKRCGELCFESWA